MNKKVNADLTIDQIISMVQETISLVFGNKTIQITSQTTALDVAGWNSLSHMIFMSQIESQFGVSFSDEEIFSMGDIGELAKLISQHLEMKASLANPV